MIKLTKQLCKRAIMGGLLLGGGGGGLLSSGMEALNETFNITDEITMLNASELAPQEIVVNVSVVGSPAAGDMYITADSWTTAFKNFELIYGKKIAGFTSSENGAISTTNGWILSAVTGIPMVDAPSDGRAHPSGTMGSIGLNVLPNYTSVQSACGGFGDCYLEIATKGALAATSHIIRESAAATGGMVAVLRNPVTAQYLSEHAAVGAFAQALKIGAMYEESSGGHAFIDRLCHELDAKVILTGIIQNYELRTDGGLDIGKLEVTDGNDTILLIFWNEYMVIEHKEERIATFPDLICTLDVNTGMAVSSAEAGNGREVCVVVIPGAQLILGAGLHQRDLFKEAEGIIHCDMTAYNSDLFEL